MACADVGDADAMRAVLAAVPSHRPLRAVHAAGVLRDGTLARVDREALVAVFQAKVRGAWTLHEITQGAAARLLRDLLVDGSRLHRQLRARAYAAANGFLDGSPTCGARTGCPRRA